MAVAGLVASVVLGVVFLVSGGSKIAAGPAWPHEAREMGAPAFVVQVLPWLEIVLGSVLVMQLVPLVAGVAALSLLVAFTTLIVRRLSEGRHPPCACFGSWSSKPLGRRHVLRNVAFSLLAAMVIVSA
jgi:uncharacterized membrane protein YphA (DoxX/SURF4 family)